MTIATFILAFGLMLNNGSTRTIESSEIRFVVERFVACKLDSATQRYAIEFRNLPTRMMNIPRKASLRVVPDPSIELRDGVLLPLEVVVDARVEHTFIVSIRVRRYEQALLALENIAKHEAGEEIAATEEIVETTTLPDDVITNHDALKGKRAKRMIRRGAVLQESMFERQPIVNQGTTVTLIVKTNSVTIWTKAIAREDGGSGDVVRVQKSGALGTLKARVLDEHTVELLAEK